MSNKYYWQYGYQPKETRRRFNTGDIFENAARCHVCGDYIRSNHRHDCVTCSCGNVAMWQWMGVAGMPEESRKVVHLRTS